MTGATATFTNNATVTGTATFSGLNATVQTNTFTNTTIISGNNAGSIANNVSSNTFNGAVTASGNANNYTSNNINQTLTDTGDTNVFTSNTLGANGHITLAGATTPSFNANNTRALDIGTTLFYGSTTGVNTLANDTHSGTITLKSDLAIASLNANITNSNIVCTNGNDPFNITVALTVAGTGNTLTNCVYDGNLNLNGTNIKLSGGSVTGNTIFANTNNVANNISGVTFNGTVAINQSGHQFTTVENNFENAVSISADGDNTVITLGDFNANATLITNAGASGINVSQSSFVEAVTINGATSTLNNNTFASTVAMTGATATFTNNATVTGLSLIHI